MSNRRTNYTLGQTDDNFNYNPGPIQSAIDWGTNLYTAAAASPRLAGARNAVASLGPATTQFLARPGVQRLIAASPFIASGIQSLDTLR